MTDIHLLEATSRPDGSLFYSRNDPNDIKMGEFVRHHPENYADAGLVIVGAPYDEGVRRNRGRPGAAGAPDEIRRALYKFPVPARARRLKIFDAGNINWAGTLEETHQRQQSVVYQLLKDGKKAVILGGGNDISFPDCTALSLFSKNLLAFNIDSHYDVRADEPGNSGTPYRQLLEGEFLRPDNFFQVAGKRIANSPEYEKYLREKGVRIYPLKELRQIGLRKFFRETLQAKKQEAIFWGFDLDAVRAEDAPGVSAGYPLGLTAEEACEIAAIAGGDARSCILEISEMNPEFDIDNRTAKLAAMIILYYLDENGALPERKNRV